MPDGRRTNSALPGAGASAPTTLHPIEEATVKAQGLAAGLMLVGTSDTLRNAADTRAVALFAPEIR